MLDVAVKILLITGKSGKNRYGLASAQYRKEHDESGMHTFSTHLFGEFLGIIM